MIINSIQKIPRDKSVFVFDLDGTLAESKVAIDSEMSDLLAKSLSKNKVAIIGGAKFEQLESQLPENIKGSSDLLLLPLDGGSFYINKDGGWKKIFSQSLSEEEVQEIMVSFSEAFEEVGYVKPAKTYGEIIENRGGQVTFSALGQNAPLEEKEKWAQEENGLRMKMVVKLEEYLPAMEAKAAGLTSIDITKKGIDKKFGIEQIVKYLGVSKDEVLFFGDALIPGGNDYPAFEAGVTCYKVVSIEDTKKALVYLLD